eukprot:TRINITY_DN558_c0_g1_i1.p1 TRINITY_DN558_c0_g1~~TRINITY_DN558_c0_g1_i1.p1  ORF type:complete len:255 (+),score=38.10 TRINITY_DN558_c0_g1_i1:235-999(+)
MEEMEEDELFESWLREGKGRIREVTPEPHSSFKLGNVVINVGVSKLIDDTNLFNNNAADQVPYQVAPERIGEDGSLVFDVVVHPSVLTPSGSREYLERLVKTLRVGIESQWPGSFSTDTITRIEPQPLEPLLIEITRNQMDRGKTVLKAALRQQRKPYEIEPMSKTTLNIPKETDPESISVSYTEGSLEIRIKNGADTVLTEYHHLPENTKMEQIKVAHRCRTGVLCVRVYADEVDARAVVLRRQLLKAKKCRQ